MNDYEAVEANRGLSPRVRGKHRVVHPVKGNLGSIPACAGEARKRETHDRAASVYPRVCGGSMTTPAIQ